ncbi:MAG: hypothetical protein U1B78_01940 [Dehalococcoidia bacterium]|nr:hypothetical protein [Dehalococcoidia bacterium]
MYLTNERLIWIRRATPLIHPFLFWIPDTIEFPLTTIDSLELVRQGPSRAWLRLKFGTKIYSFRLGEGPYPLLKDNPTTTQVWFDEIQGGSVGGTVATRREPLPGENLPSREGIALDTNLPRLVGVAWTLLIVVAAPAWIAGFLLTGVPASFFVVMGVASGMGIAIGLSVAQPWRRGPE